MDSAIKPTMMISGLLASVFATGVAALGTTVAAPCACADPAHCAPIAAAAAADREIFAFFDDNKTWPNLDYEVATTACAYMDGPAEQVDPAFVCHAHSKGVRAVRNAPFAKDQLGTIGNSTVRAMWVAMWMAILALASVSLVVHFLPLASKLCV